MNYKPGIWYNELYRIFSDNKMLTVAQTAQLGQCLRAIQAGENASYHLNQLYYALEDTPYYSKLKNSLNDYIHAYLKHYEEDINNDEDS